MSAKSSRFIFSLVGLSILVLGSSGVLIFPYDNEYYRALGMLTYPKPILSSVVFFVISVFLLFPFAYRSKRVYRALSPVVLFLVAFSALSAFWSLDPVSTLSLSLKIACLVLAISASVYVLGKRNASVMIWYISALVVALSFFAAMVGSPLVVMAGKHDGLWRGFFNHKNTFGPFLSCFIILSLFLYFERSVDRRFLLLMGCVALCSLVFAEAMTAIVSLLGSLCLVFLVSAPKFFPTQRYAVAGVSIVTIVGLCLFAFNYSDAFLALMGRDPSLSGRSEIWSAAASISYSYPFGLGYGTSGGSLVLDAIRSESGWMEANSAHSAYLAMALGFGWLATSFFVIWLIYLVFFKSFSGADSMYFSVALIAAFVGISSLTESSGGFNVSYPLLVLILLYTVERQHSVSRER